MSDDWIDEWRAASGTAAINDEPEADAPEPSIDDDPAAERAEPPRPAARRPRPRGNRRALYPLLGLGALLLIVVVGVVAFTGGRQDDPDTITIPAQTPPSTISQPETVPSPISCTETNTPTRLVTAKPGDTHTAAGLIAAFEHAYFTERNPIAAAEHLDASMRVTPSAIRGVMDANFPPGDEPVPYCATVTPWNDPNTWAVSVDWVDERTREVNTWAAVYEVTAVKGQLRITAQRTTD
ncbi:hypothetical protein FOV72_19690 [Gordonia rubripertincta]|uniref:hypothetical protein n=1 Tax=Gordonia rubripertincta TaxID=36822 RepID=UPI00117E88F0|nr:hypothetical protein [Gordonia rubripertincta]TSD93485.1 hypothetical protein FOV72_19690 [Gordonia rubripertincta]